MWNRVVRKGLLKVLTLLLVAPRDLVAVGMSRFGLVCLSFTALSTFFGYLELRQKPVSGITLLLQAKQDRDSLKCVSQKEVRHTTRLLLTSLTAQEVSDWWRAPPAHERAICRSRPLHLPEWMCPAYLPAIISHMLLQNKHMSYILIKSTLEVSTILIAGFKFPRPLAAIFI